MNQITCQPFEHDFQNAPSLSDRKAGTRARRCSRCGLTFQAEKPIEWDWPEAQRVQRMMRWVTERPKSRHPSPSTSDKKAKGKDYKILKSSNKGGGKKRGVKGGKQRHRKATTIVI